MVFPPVLFFSNIDTAFLAAPGSGGSNRNVNAGGKFPDGSY